METAGATAHIYHRESKGSEVEVEEWLRRRRSSDEERVLIADPQVSRGWESTDTLLVDLYGEHFENLVMGSCALVKRAPTDSQS